NVYFCDNLDELYRAECGPDNPLRCYIPTYLLRARFVVTQFIEDVREVMGLPEWMSTVDSCKTRTLHGGTCIQFLLHFKGPLANQLEQDFSRLLANGFLASPSLYNPGFVPSSKRKTNLSYRPCGSRDPNSKSAAACVAKSAPLYL
ncbi:hypothetical protein L9F63_005495, partial [Diploptera punctata]